MTHLKPRSQKPATRSSEAEDPMQTETYPVEGMTCASCILRVEKALTGVDGVAGAAANLATEKVRVEFDPAKVTPERLRAAVAGAGYTLVVAGAAATAEAASPALRIRRELVFSAALALPVMLISMLSGVVFDSSARVD